MQEKVIEILDKIRPGLQADGGDLRFVKIEDGVVFLELEGACKGCPMSQMTLKMGIERTLKKYVPEVVGVESV